MTYAKLKDNKEIIFCWIPGHVHIAFKNHKDMVNLQPIETQYHPFVLTINYNDIYKLSKVNMHGIAIYNYISLYDN